MKFDAGTRTRLLATMTLDFDPTGSTVEVKVDATWYPATWQGAPVETQVRDERTGQTKDAWTQTARTTGYFAGPEVAAPAGAVVLSATAGSPAGRHLTQTRVTSGSDIIVADASPIDVG